MPKMPKKKSRNAFFYYMLDFKERHERKGERFSNGLQDVSVLASKSWIKMTATEKSPYELRAKSDTGGTGNNSNLSNIGVPVQTLNDRRNQQIRTEAVLEKKISEIVRLAAQANTLDTQEFYFIACNYFCQNKDGSYTPAELSLSAYNLRDGQLKTYHAFINPEKLELGMAYDASGHASRTHKLPLPPKAMGHSNYWSIINDINDFLPIRLSKYEPHPPLFTAEPMAPIVRSTLQYLYSKSGENDVAMPTVYPTSCLLFNLKTETERFGASAAQAVPTLTLAGTLMERDPFDWRQGMACDFHEEEDATKFCTLSMVIRWGFMICDHCNIDLQIKMIPGKHLPADTHVAKPTATSSIASSCQTNYMTQNNAKPNISKVDPWGFQNGRETMPTQVTVMAGFGRGRGRGIMTSNELFPENSLGFRRKK